MQRLLFQWNAIDSHGDISTLARRPQLKIETGARTCSAREEHLGFSGGCDCERPCLVGTDWRPSGCKKHPMVVARHVQPIGDCVNRLELSDQIYCLNARGLA